MLQVFGRTVMCLTLRNSPFQLHDYPSFHKMLVAVALYRLLLEVPFASASALAFALATTYDEGLADGN